MDDLEHAGHHQHRADEDDAGDGEGDHIEPRNDAEHDLGDAEGDEPAPAGARAGAGVGRGEVAHGADGNELRHRYGNPPASGRLFPSGRGRMRPRSGPTGDRVVQGQPMIGTCLGRLSPVIPRVTRRHDRRRSAQAGAIGQPAARRAGRGLRRHRHQPALRLQGQPAAVRRRADRRTVEIMGILSLIFWSLDADRHGEIRHARSCAPTTAARAASWR